jgi:tetratricopeptide (TPR) repeat protein
MLAKFLFSFFLLVFSLAASADTAAPPTGGTSPDSGAQEAISPASEAAAPEAVREAGAASDAPGTAAAEPTEATEATTAAPRATARPKRPESVSRQVFLLLLAEVALQRNQLELAVSAYHDLAMQTRDPAIVQRATELAIATERNDEALRLVKLWTRIAPESRQARLAEIHLLLLTGRLDDLAEPMDRFLAAEPDNLGSNLLNLNRLLARYPEKRAALAFMQRIADRYPESPEARYAIAVLASGNGQSTRAREAARQAWKLKPDWFAPVMLETQILLQGPGEEAAQVDEAVAILSTFLEKNPDSTEARMMLARLLLSARRYLEARAQVDLLLEKDPQNLEMVYSVAMLALQEKDIGTARLQLERLANSAFSDQNAVQYFLGLIAEEEKDKERALSHFRQVSGGAQYLFARLRIAESLAETGDVDAALAFLRETRTRSAQEKVGRVLMESQLLRKAERHQAAYETLAEAQKANPETPELLYDLALAAEKVGKVKEMEQHLKKLITLDPDNAHALNALGYSLADRNLRLAEAHDLIRRAVDLAPEDPFIMDSMGWVLYRQGKIEEAITTLENAYTRKADPEIAAHLGEVLWVQGRREEAAALWEKAAREAPKNETLNAAIRRFRP